MLIIETDYDFSINADVDVLNPKFTVENVRARVNGHANNLIVPGRSND